MIKKTFEFGSHCSGWPTDIGIYRIYCKENGKSYVGKADGRRGFRQRWQNHQSKARIDKNECVLLQRAYKKYGEGAFVFEILEILERGSDVDIRRREWYWMDELDVYDNGYNLTRYTEEDFIVKEIRIKLPTPFKFLDTDRNIVEGADVYQFAKDYKLSPSRLISLSNQIIHVYKNYRSLSFDFGEIKDSNFQVLRVNFYQLTSPNGEFVEFTNIEKFIQSQEFDSKFASGFRRFLLRDLSSSYQGWEKFTRKEKLTAKTPSQRYGEEFSIELDTGEKISGIIKDYCNKNDFAIWNFCKFIDRKIPLFKGMVLKKNDSDYAHHLKSPEGDLHHFDNVERFSRKGSNPPVWALYSLLKGKIRDYYGWSLPETDLSLTSKWTGNSIPVKQVDISTGGVIAVFEKITDAAISLKRQSTLACVVSKIAACLRGERSTAYQYRWYKAQSLKDFDPIKA